eukprot:TRINITY_DN11621_c0_g3_i1.p1 TRINITY_DN11621_c0_g3~~TRINITY_DN11621_c0_g3_i1.p1  ORF type:complete len:388 (+),score=170.49 TRINITY_DN11621_c0_g3_i1:77-1240(+)
MASNGTVDAGTTVEEIALELREAVDSEARVQQVIAALMKAAALSAKNDIFRFYELGGVSTVCKLIEQRETTGADDIDYKTLVMLLCQTLLGVGQIRSYMSLRGALPGLCQMAASILLLKDLASGSHAELVQVKVLAANCLNLLPIPHDEWVKYGIPELAMELLSDTTYPSYPASEAQLEVMESTNLLDAGLVVATNFCASQDFFNRVMELGICEQVTLIGQRLAAEEEKVRTSPEYSGTMLRFIALLMVLYAVEEGRAKLEFIAAGSAEDTSLIHKVLPDLATHDHMQVRSIAHQLLAEYTGVTEPSHVWIDESIPAANINETEPAFDMARPCSNPLCNKEEEAPLSFKWCSRCKVTAYCGAACQKLHWTHHKSICKWVAIPAAQAG